ncbi:MAG: 2-amino-4-hydroxy-6-hydroxymethyldihydropteridine diphosphokinase [Moraxellaceae bacterium]|nr:MAG: 2-amino-4-hydroxy-6-hydroxymethyldihydropteridine diphosphokinase [Moraxellaceae bacterium]
MARVYLSLGSNIDRDRHISAGLDALADLFGALRLSPVYESEAVGFEGDAFYNLVVGLESDLSVVELSACVKKIEDENGRLRSGPRFSSRTLDIDILTVGDLYGEFGSVQLPRDEIEKNAFVLLPLSDIAADEIHPMLGVSYGEMWQSYAAKQKLWQVPFVWPVV